MHFHKTKLEGKGKSEMKLEGDLKSSFLIYLMQTEFMSLCFGTENGNKDEQKMERLTNN